METKENKIITVKNFTASYGDEVVLDNISFDVEQGEVFVILGGSGCGKSTLLKHMIGLYEPSTGEIIIDGDNIVGTEGTLSRGISGKSGCAVYMWKNSCGNWASLTFYNQKLSLLCPREQPSGLPFEPLEFPFSSYCECPHH